MAEPRRKAGRPPVQHIKHVHVLSLSPELEEKIGDLQETFIKGKALRAAGEAAKGVLSHPAGVALLITLTIWGLGRLGLWKTIFPGATGAVEAMGGFLDDYAAAEVSLVDDIGVITMGAFTKFMKRVLDVIKIPV